MQIKGICVCKCYFGWIADGEKQGTLPSHSLETWNQLSQTGEGGEYKGETESEEITCVLEKDFSPWFLHVLKTAFGKTKIFQL